MKPTLLQKTGYLQVMLGQRMKVAVHRLVADAFCEKPDGCNVVNHRNSDRTDNRAENIEWTTVSGNLNHHINGENFSRDQTTWRPVVSECIKTGEVIIYLSMQEAAALGYRKPLICVTCQGKQKKHAGKRWFYYDEWVAK